MRYKIKKKINYNKMYDVLGQAKLKSNITYILQVISRLLKVSLAKF